MNYESLKCIQSGFHGEKLGFVKTSQPLPKLRKGQKYSNPRISYDGKYWFLSIGYEVKEEPKPELSGVSLGIDLGVKDLAILSDGRVFKNINKTHEVRRLEKNSGVNKEKRPAVFDRILKDMTKTAVRYGSVR